MPKAATTKLMTKEMGGRAQVAFRKALGLCESEDIQFQETKHHIRALAVKHFELGRKPREQAEYRRNLFMADVYKIFPVFRRDDCANDHLLKYIHQFLHSKAVPSSSFYKTAHRNNNKVADIADDGICEEGDKSDDDDESMLIPRDSPSREETPAGRFQVASSDFGERTEGTPHPFKPCSQPRKRARDCVEDPQSPTLVDSQDRIFSLEPNLFAAIPNKCFSSHKNSDQQGRGSSPSQTTFSKETSEVSPIKAFLGCAEIGHLLEIFTKLGIKNQSHFRMVAAWLEQDLNEFLRDSVRENRIDRVEAHQLSISFRSLRRPKGAVEFELDDICALL